LTASLMQSSGSSLSLMGSELALLGVGVVAGIAGAAVVIIIYWLAQGAQSIRHKRAHKPRHGPDGEEGSDDGQ